MLRAKNNYPVLPTFFTENIKSLNTFSFGRFLKMSQIASKFGFIYRYKSLLYVLKLVIVSYIDFSGVCRTFRSAMKFEYVIKACRFLICIKYS